MPESCPLGRPAFISVGELGKNSSACIMLGERSSRLSNICGVTELAFDLRDFPGDTPEHLFSSFQRIALFVAEQDTLFQDLLTDRAQVAGRGVGFHSNHAQTFETMFRRRFLAFWLRRSQPT